MKNYASSFGLAGDDYRKYRQGFPLSLYIRLKNLKIGLRQQKLLDVGTGTGVMARQFANVGCEVTASDIDPRMLEQAKTISEQESLDITFIESATESLNLPSESFDVISAGQCWHWFDWPKASHEMLRLLKPGGKLVIAHYDWIPFTKNLVEQTEALVLKYNSDWPFASGVGIHSYGLKPLAEAGFIGIETASYDDPALYSHEAWRGRMRASNGVINMDEANASAFDIELKDLLAHKFPEEPLRVDHRVFYIIANKPND